VARVNQTNPPTCVDLNKNSVSPSETRVIIDKSMLVSDESLMPFEIPCLVRETRGSGQAKRVQPMEDGTGQNTMPSRNDEGSGRNFPRY